MRETQVVTGETRPEKDTFGSRKGHKEELALTWTAQMFEVSVTGVYPSLQIL